VVRYTPSHYSNNPRYKYFNATDLNCMIDDLKPNTQYEFTVKVVKVRLVVMRRGGCGNCEALLNAWFMCRVGGRALGAWWCST
jgi:hypothetical protein